MADIISRVAEDQLTGSLYCPKRVDMLALIHHLDARMMHGYENSFFQSA